METVHAAAAFARHFRLVLVLFVAGALAAPSGGAAQASSRPITIGEARSIRSNVLQEEREILIALPQSYARTAVGYPVLFLLDGGSHLFHATATVRFLASARDRIPEMIVVALPNTNRNRDLTPGPGAIAFQRFLGEELIPWIESNYRTAPERILMGHSLGGSFVTHALLNRVDLFDAYIAVSAPLWRYDSLARDSKAGLARAAQAGAALYLTVGEHENERLRQGVDRFAASLESADSAAVPAWSFAVLADEDHSSTAHRSLYNALETRYAEFRFPFFEDLAELDSIGGLKGLEAHYDRFSKRFGYQSVPPESRILAVGRLSVAAERHDEALQLAAAYAGSYPAVAEQLTNATGYDQMQRGQFAEAVQTFRQNVERFPNSPNVHDSLGDGYCRIGDRAAAGESRLQAVRVAEQLLHPRLQSYRAKLEMPCEQGF